MEKRRHIRLCPECGSEVRMGVCLLCGQGERTSVFNLPFVRYSAKADQSFERMLNYYIGTPKEEVR